MFQNFLFCLVVATAFLSNVADTFSPSSNRRGVSIINFRSKSVASCSRASTARHRVEKSLHLLTTLKQNADNVNENDENVCSNKSLKRRDFVNTSATVASTIIPSMFSIPSVNAEEGTTASINNKSSPIVIIGANGKTGSECVGVCLSSNLPLLATSRTGAYTGAYASFSPPTSVCDVTIPSTVDEVVKGSRAVIFAASASKAGGTPSEVDNVGLINVAKACIKERVPSLVIVSSGAVTQPNSPVYKFLNLFGNIMEEKVKGEDAVRIMYKGNNGGNEGTCTYTIIRPGGLTEEQGRGVSFIELNQGDKVSGRIARADVAALCVEAALTPNLTGGTTFECYDKDTSKPIQTVGLSNIMKQKNKADDNVFKTGKERQGSTFEELFTGLEKDF